MEIRKEQNLPLSEQNLVLCTPLPRDEVESIQFTETKPGEEIKIEVKLEEEERIEFTEMIPTNGVMLEESLNLTDETNCEFEPVGCPDISDPNLESKEDTKPVPCETGEIMNKPDVDAADHDADFAPKPDHDEVESDFRIIPIQIEESAESIEIDIKVENNVHTEHAGAFTGEHDDISQVQTNADPQPNLAVEDPDSNVAFSPLVGLKKDDIIGYDVTPGKPEPQPVVPAPTEEKLLLEPEPRKAEKKKSFIKEWQEDLKEFFGVGKKKDKKAIESGSSDASRFSTLESKKTRNNFQH